MNEEQEKKLNEVHEMLSFFKKVYDDQLAGKVFNIEGSPDPTDEPCPKVNELKG